MRFFGGEIDDIGAVANHNRKPGGVMNPNTHALGATAAVVALMLFIAYRRIRRSIGRQPFQPTRMKVRMAVLALAGLAFVVVPRGQVLILAGAAVGILAGVALAVYALKHTQFEFTETGTFYTGHPYIGLGIALLFVGRLVYRFVAMSTMAPVDGPRSVSPFAGAIGNPITTGVFFVVAGYYLTYYAGLLRRGSPQPAA